MLGPEFKSRTEKEEEEEEREEVAVAAGHGGITQLGGMYLYS